MTMEKLKEGIGDFVRPKNKFDGQGEIIGLQDGGNTSNYVRFWDMGSEESTREEVVCSGY